jgi:hypothetical protein
MDLQMLAQNIWAPVLYMSWVNWKLRDCAREKSVCQLEGGMSKHYVIEARIGVKIACEIPIGR